MPNSVLISKSNLSDYTNWHIQNDTFFQSLAEIWCVSLCGGTSIIEFAWNKRTKYFQSHITVYKSQQKTAQRLLRIICEGKQSIDINNSSISFNSILIGCCCPLFVVVSIHFYISFAVYLVTWDDDDDVFRWLTAVKCSVPGKLCVCAW